jgi:uncharacterized protein YaaN involved in tellurite resistance
MSESVPQQKTAGEFTLTPPEFQPPVPARAAPDVVPLDPELKTKVEAQVDAFVQGLMTADVHGEDFKRRMDAAFKLGRKEIAEATRLNTAFTRQSYRGIEGTPAFQAMAELRNIMDQMNPVRFGDLFEPTKLLGFLPGGDKLKAYFRKFESASTQIDVLVQRLSEAQDDLERDAIALEDAKKQLWDAMQNLKAAAHFSQVLQAKLKAQVEGLRAADPNRARVLEQEALFYAVQNYEGILTQVAVTVNGYLAMEPLKKTAREMSIGIDRLKTTGMSALAVAQTIAIATGNQMRIQEAMQKTRDVIGNLVAQSAAQLHQHAQTVGKAATDPTLELGKLQSAFDQTFKALDAMDSFRSAAIASMSKNNEALQALIDKSRPYVERAAQGAAAGKPDPSLAGPVAL